MTILVVTHDLEFSASIADECSLIFDGRIVAKDETSSFFRDNAFYTTDIFRMTRGIVNPVTTMKEWATMLVIDSEECRHDLG
jgi:energy-coupling factor transport system ATP-binding protein